MMLLSIAGREIRSLFLSPIAWTMLAVIQVILAWLFLKLVERFSYWQPQLVDLANAPGITELVVTPLLKSAGFVLLLVVPLLSMGSVSEERRSGTLMLLLSAPVSMTEIVLGKYLGLLSYLAFVLGLISLFPLSLLTGANLDFGLLAAGFLGLALMLASMAAIGLFMSTLSGQPLIAGACTFGLLFLLWILDWAGHPEAGGGVFSHLALAPHFDAFLRGLFDTKDLAYFVLLIFGFLVLSIRQMDADRLRG